MSKWKEVGSAGKEHEDALWNEFNGYRQFFYEKRNAYYDALHNEQNAHYEAKLALVEQAKAIVESENYAKENTEKMKQLNVEWKNIGSCGKDKEDEIWSTFRSLMDNYFQGLKDWNNQRQENWRQRMIEIRTRKLDMIQTQKRQIQRMQNEIIGLLGERAIHEMNEDIKEKEEFIIELEKEVQEIDAKLTNV